MKNKLHIASLFLFLFIGLLIKDNLHFLDDTNNIETELMKENSDVDDNSDDESNDEEEDNDNDFDKMAPYLYENVILSDLSNSEFTDQIMVSDNPLSELFSPPDFS